MEKVFEGEPERMPPTGTREGFIRGQLISGPLNDAATGLFGVVDSNGYLF